ncbi:hypothetical protein JRO89_XS01G0351400 [Xanthoceras sorbifolium]|uniref:SWIM-type domain-containing protein n=1 Tax=Xanthoceras sorbifolium TaxID=99658 RepID=A0ABQ8INA1_9ROSI|nr:hypothetical protein JRO89_XS01G0351400 [Xanthoceras sorbifolium]
MVIKLYRVSIGLREELKKDLQGSCTEEDVNVIVVHLYDAAHAGTLDGFRKSIGSIKQISAHACEWILLSEPEHWANALFEGLRYNHISSAIAESFYSWVTELPVLPVVQIIDTVRRKIMELIYTRRMDSNRWLTRLTPTLEDKLQKEILKAQSLQVQLGLNSAFEVCDCLGVVNVVNIDIGKCSCGDWQLNGYPCFHAVAVLQRMGEDLYNYCSKYYTTETFRSTYTESINPLPPVDKQPVDSESEQVLPPPLRRASGPPKKRRIRSKGINCTVPDIGRYGDVVLRPWTGIDVELFLTLMGILGEFSFRWDVYAPVWHSKHFYCLVLMIASDLQASTSYSSCCRLVLFFMLSPSLYISKISIMVLATDDRVGGKTDHAENVVLVFAPAAVQIAVMYKERPAK